MCASKFILGNVFYLQRFLLNLSHILLTQIDLPHFLWSGNFPNSVSMLTFSEVSRFQALHELNTSFLLFSFTYASHHRELAKPKLDRNSVQTNLQQWYHITPICCICICIFFVSTTWIDFSSALSGQRTLDISENTLKDSSHSRHSLVLQC